MFGNIVLSIEELVLSFLKENPGSKPREIAEALGISYNRVRIALYKLREKGLVMRTEKGYTATHRAEFKPFRREKQIIAESMEKKDIVQTLSEKLSRLEEKVNAMEKRIEEIENALEGLRIEIRDLEILSKKLSKDLDMLRNRLNGFLKYSRKYIMRKQVEDEFLIVLSAEKILNINKARNLASRPIEDYVRENKIIVISSYVVDKEFYEEFKKLFPISKNEVEALNEKFKLLLRAMVDEGLAYLHRGIEYRIA
ncbi:MAG: hypothetical protein B6U76_00620 [Desulfurococcales archaeon ex4484_217_2]|nr:MAG: hypothetical protein B6U76_00620 [Desulfurococcales archaeon ex4484_217_2]